MQHSTSLARLPRQRMTTQMMISRSLRKLTSKRPRTEFTRSTRRERQPASSYKSTRLSHWQVGLQSQIWTNLWYIAQSRVALCPSSKVSTCPDTRTSQPLIGLYLTPTGIHTLWENSNSQASGSLPRAPPLGISTKPHHPWLILVLSARKASNNAQIVTITTQCLLDWAQAMKRSTTHSEAQRNPSEAASRLTRRRMWSGKTQARTRILQVWVVSSHLNW